MGSQAQVKIIGSNGQISLGKEFAGKTVIVVQIDAHSWIIKTGEFVPDSEQWLHEPKHMAKLDKALQWAKTNKPTDNFDALIKKLGKEIDGEQHKN